ncbi:hypothetical protein SDC9_80581 [bioreactor metagenome]|uniref:Uncharacterized protein n=1 Tax=bioreactor metagenome TaxID=1076179 RepID=A0A644YZG8_9ZZZZ
MAGIIDVHRMDQRIIRCLLPDQVIAIRNQVTVRVMIFVIKNALFDEGIRIQLDSILHHLKRRMIVELAHPVVAGRPRLEPVFLGDFKNTPFFGTADCAVRGDAIFCSRHSRLQDFIQRP